MVRIFVTGATGYIGLALCRRLREAGHQVGALVRPTSRTEPLQRLGVATYTGDVTDRYSLRQGMSGCDWVIHAAAELNPQAPARRMWEANVLGSTTVASLGYKLGVGRLLSISSVAYFGGSPPDGTPATEETPPQLPFPSRYSATKHQGERRIREWAERGLRVNTVYPSLVYGPPGKGQGVNALLRSLLRRQMPAVVAADRKTSWVYLDDVVEGILRVMAGAPVGRDYLLAGEVVPIGELVKRVCRLAEIRPPRLRLSAPTAWVLAVLAWPFYRLLGRRPPFALDQLRSLRRHWAFDDSRARQELHWRPRPLAQGLPPTVEFLKSS